MTAKSLLAILHANEPDVLEQVRDYIGDGAYLDAMTEHGETALRVASNGGRFDVVALLLASGAEKSQLEWTDSIEATVFGTPESLRASVRAHRDLEAVDFWERTPFLFAVLLGDCAKAALLLELGADRAALGRCGKTPAAYAIQNDDVTMLKWLAAQGFDMEARNGFQETPLIVAAEDGKAASVRFLCGLGVDIYNTEGSGRRAMELATSIEVVRILTEYGDDQGDMSDEAHAALIGVTYDGHPTVDAQAYHAGGHRTFGESNPHQSNVPFWLDMIRSDATAWRARDKYGALERGEPVWSYRRSGRSTTLLADGRIIDIGGVHEDFYDPDFCIYNDVTVFDGKGEIAILTYPAEVFPPTDFHTATLAGDAVYIIGNLGYATGRRPGETPIFKLDLRSFRIDEVASGGACPGWIYRHKSRLDGDAAIIVSGGRQVVMTEGLPAQIDNTSQYRLCLKTFAWSAIPPA